MTAPDEAAAFGVLPEAERSDEAAADAPHDGAASDESGTGAAAHGELPVVMTSDTPRGRHAGTRARHVEIVVHPDATAVADATAARLLVRLIDLQSVRSPLHVVVTGGEPMLFAELIPLCARLREVERHITIETAGTLYLPVVCDLMSISPKFASSAPDAAAHPRWHRRHERERYRPEVVRRLIADDDYQLKFVIDTPEDLLSIEQSAELPQPPQQNA